MVYITGDMHGDLSRFKNPIFKKMKAGDVLIVCGDFWFIWDGSLKAESEKAAGNAATMGFVDGCHENFDILNKASGPSAGVAAGHISLPRIFST
ncbi:MAG: hypothetical protein ACLT3Y_10330 [Ruminococcus callidus]